MKLKNPNLTSGKKVYRPSFVSPSLEGEKIIGKNEIKTWSRSSTILESFVGKRFLIYNGKTFTAVTIRPEMVGYKLGTFARTRRRGKDPRPKASARKK